MGEPRMTGRFERHRQPWRHDEIQKLHTFAGKGMSVRPHRQGAHEDPSVRSRLAPKADRLKIVKLR
jgi:hypothetical protein